MTKKRTRTDAELIDTLSKDWLERDGDSFVHIRKTGRTGWEESLEKGSAYSSFLIDASRGSTPQLYKCINKHL